MAAEELFPEDFEPTSLPLILSDSARKVAGGVADRVRAVLELREELRRELRASGRLRPIPRDAPPLSCVAIDSGYTVPSLDLVVGKLVIYVRSCTFWRCSPPRPSRSEAAVKFYTDAVPEDLPKLETKVFERQLALELLDAKERGDADFDVLLLDGEIVPRGVPPGLRRNPQLLKRIVGKVLGVTRELVEKARATGTPVIGIVKRVQGKDLSLILNRRLGMNDKAVATLVLNPGEYVYMGDVETIRSLARRSEERRWRERARYLELILSHVPKLASVEVVVYKSRNYVMYGLATKAEVLEVGDYSLTELVAWLSRITSQTGVPYPIDLVDELSRVRPEVVACLHQRLMAMAVEEARSIGVSEAAVVKALGLLNPEKSFPYYYWRNLRRLLRR